MSRPLIRAALLALLALPAQAQDAGPARLAEGFLAASRAFVLPGAAPGLIDPEAAEGVAVALVAGIEGRWLRGLEAMFPDPLAFSPEVVATGCERLGGELVATGPRGFELRVPIGRGEAGHVAERFDYVYGNTFLRSVDEAALLRRLLGDEAESPEMASTRGTILQTAPRGEAMVFHPAEDVLVIAMPGRPPEFWGRCP